MGKRVLFVEKNLINEKLGIMYLAGSLKAHGHHANMVQADKENLDDFIADYKPDFVAFSITSGEHVFALQTARYIKQKFGIPNIFGGPHCTFFPEIGFEPDLDFVVQGQSEGLIIDLVEGRVKPGFHRAEMANHLDDLPFPDRSLFYQYKEFRERPMKSVMTSRACPYKCSYCFNHSQYALTKIDGSTRRWFDRRSIENIAAEVEAISQNYPLEKIVFPDDNFIQSQPWLHEFLDGYTREIHLPWACSLRVNSLNEELCRKMAESGLEVVNYAMESADPDVQQRLLNRGHITNLDIMQAIAMFNEHGVRARMQNIIGLPLKNSLEDAFNTLQFNIRNKVIDSWCSIFQPYPRTALGQYSIDNGFIKEEDLSHCSESFFDESRINIEHKDQIYALQKLWYFVVAFDLSLDLVQILSHGKFHKRVGDQIQKLRYHYSRNRLYQIDAADPEKAVDFQSREKWAHRNVDDDLVPGSQSQVIAEALQGSGMSPRLIEILTQVEFSPKEIEDLKSYASGKKVYPDPVYTINDKTGELQNPNISIFTRGVENPDAQDIRKMPEAHFMKDMVRIREELKVFSLKKENEKINILPTPLSHEAIAAKPEVTGEDKQHLNQFMV